MNVPIPKTDEKTPKNEILGNIDKNSNITP
jgi:hypothetical protein